MTPAATADTDKSGAKVFFLPLTGAYTIGDETRSAPRNAALSLEGILRDLHELGPAYKEAPIESRVRQRKAELSLRLFLSAARWPVVGWRY